MSPVPFGYKMAWLAVRTASPEQVVEALGIDDARPTGWDVGVDAVYAQEATAAHPAFVSPALGEWTLIASPAFFEEVSDAEPERIGDFVTRIAEELETEVQLFATHRVVEGHAWARADTSGLTRAYFYLGEIGECLLDLGEPTTFERTLDCLAPDAVDPPDEEAVMSVAGAWSVDPTALETTHPDAGSGLLGTVRRPDVEAEPEPNPPVGGKPWWKFWSTAVLLVLG